MSRQIAIGAALGQHHHIRGAQQIALHQRTHEPWVVLLRQRLVRVRHLALRPHHVLRVLLLELRTDSVLVRQYIPLHREFHLLFLLHKSGVEVVLPSQLQHVLPALVRLRQLRHVSLEQSHVLLVQKSAPFHSLLVDAARSDVDAHHEGVTPP